MAELFGPADTPGSVSARPADARVFGPDDRWYKKCSDPDADDGTEASADDMNAILANLRALVRGMGAAIDNTSDDMVLNAVKLAMVPYAVDVGAADAAVATFSPALAAYGNRLFAVKWSYTNATTAPSINVNGLGAKTLKTAAGAALIAGAITPGVVSLCIYDGTNVRILTGLAVGFNTLAYWGAAGNYTWTCPAGVTRVRARGKAGGGGGPSSAGGWNGSAGGEGGEFEGYFTVVPGTDYAITIGAGGTAASMGVDNAGNGGSTSFASFASATGGAKGTFAATSGTAVPGGLGGTAIGGQRNISGQTGQASNASANSNYPVGGGMGGHNGSPGVKPGSGGGPGTSSTPSGAGKAGELVLEMAA